jgi:sugar-specific transcriptional regulator TrmB
MKLIGIKDSLKKLGFTKAEVEIYLALLAGGSLAVQHLVEATKLPRTTIVLALDKFLEENIASYYVKGKRKYFVVRDPAQLLNLLTRKESEIYLKKMQIEKIIPELEALHYLKSQGAIETEFLQGEEGFKKIFNATIDQKKKGEILRFGVDPKMFNVLPDFLKEFVKEKNKKLITTKLLLPNSDPEFIKAIKGEDKNDLRETRALDPEIYNPPGNIAIWEDNVAFIAWDKDLHIMHVKNRLFYQMMRMIFMACWESAKK